jgi:sugar O-acyltransferase (sialic acid O-acetyltransferase NeuD family)
MIDCNPHSAAAQKFRRLLIFGAGGFGREVAWLAQQCWDEHMDIAFCVDQPRYVSAPVNGIPVRLLEDFSGEVGDQLAYVVAVGDPEQRARIVGLYEAMGIRAATLVHPRVEASRWIEIGAGSILCAGVIATTNISIGAHVHINLDCTIGHDVIIGDFATLSPGVHVSGNVTVGKRVFIGTGATIINGSTTSQLSIGDGAVVAAGACITKPVEPGALVAGVPAVRKR